MYLNARYALKNNRYIQVQAQYLQEASMIALISAATFPTEGNTGGMFSFKNELAILMLPSPTFRRVPALSR